MAKVRNTLHFLLAAFMYRRQNAFTEVQGQKQGYSLVNYQTICQDNPLVARLSVHNVSR